MLTRLAKSLAPIFRPPFDGLWLVVIFYYAWCFMVFPHSQIVRGNLPDPDDYMYLVQTLDWLQGQGWYDNIQHRLNPPDGVPIHFSRLAQLPMAALIGLFQLFGLGIKGAAMLTALLYPLFLLAGLLFALRWLAECFVPKKWAGAVAFITLFATTALFMFTPGHVDHHNLVMIITVLALGCVMRMDDEPANPLWGLAAGLLLSLGMAVALEILPWLLIISLWVGLWATARGGAATRNALGFGLALYLGSALWLGLARPPDQWLVMDVLSYSAVYVVLAGSMAVTFAGLHLARNAPALTRWLVGAGGAAVTGFFFLHTYPDLWAGPYGGISPEMARIMLEEIDEAIPLVKSDNTWRSYVVRLGGVAIATVAAIAFFWRAKPAPRWRWGLLIGLLLAATYLTVFYQYRFIGMAGLFTIVPLTVLLQRGWARIRKFEPRSRKIFAQIGLLLLVGPLTAVLLPVLVGARSVNAGILLFPVDGSVTKTPCDTYVLEQVLHDPKMYGDKPRLILSSMGLGPELLFRTQHQVLAAPFHMDVTGNVDSTRFFSTPYTSEAEAIARRRKIDLVVTCIFVPHIYTRAPGTVSGKDFAPHFVERLLTGTHPSWLKRVKIPALRNFVVFEVLPESSGAKPR